MGKVLDFLRGKKTYVVGALMAIVAGAHAVKALVPALQSVDDSTFQKIMDILRGFLAEDGGGLALIAMTIRAAIGKVE